VAINRRTRKFCQVSLPYLLSGAFRTDVGEHFQG
jgi:hypothetical protein